MNLRATIESFLGDELGPDYRERRYLLAVSGGLDSVVLLHLFRSLLPPSQILVAHYDHGTRPESQADAAWVAAFCDRLEVESLCVVREGGPTDEASLRRDRLGFLEMARAQYRCDFIVTAHHADDQLETLLMRMIRGTGIEGLAGIAPRRDYFLRPLLTLTRGQLQSYCAEHALEFRQDSTNSQPRYFRNRIRHELVPVLKNLAEDFGGDEALLARTAALAEEARATGRELDQHARSLFAHLMVHTAFWTRLDAQLFAKLSEFWRARLLRTALSRMEVATLDRTDIQRLDEFAESAVPAMSFHGFRVRRSCGYLYLETPAQAARLRADKTISVEGERVYVPDLEVAFTLPAGWFENHELRFFTAGDRMGDGKLKEWLLRQGIPQPERRLLPLLAKKGKTEVVWVFPQAVPGFHLETAAFPFAPAVRRLPT